MTGAATRAGPVPQAAPGDVLSATPAEPCHGMAGQLPRQGVRPRGCGPAAMDAGLLDIVGLESVASSHKPVRARTAANARSSGVTCAPTPSAHPEEGA
ncbi:hypothetical protein [Streptomyces sp. NPDC005799]|uniref:hypothetical protein n=1 Tax=Streptomyces sp. NPDC005799 TaxID=3154678 RepID=UPI0033CC13C3